MAAIAFDTLAYVRRIVAAGVPREQAEAQADAMKEAFVHNVDALVTRDYLDTRFTEFETRVEANMDRRFTAMEINVDKRFTEVDQRFSAMESRMDKRFVEVAHRFDGLELRFERIDSKFSKIYLMFGMTMVTATIPILQNFLGQ
jgi:hypothetical protein